jgi:hypothetical protein
VMVALRTRTARDRLLAALLLGVACTGHLSHLAAVAVLGLVLRGGQASVAGMGAASRPLPAGTDALPLPGVGRPREPRLRLPALRGPHLLSGHRRARRGAGLAVRAPALARVRAQPDSRLAHGVPSGRPAARELEALDSGGTVRAGTARHRAARSRTRPAVEAQPRRGAAHAGRGRGNAAAVGAGVVRRSVRTLPAVPARAAVDRRAPG